MVKSNLQTILN
ncbi:hypothetical protein R3I94_018161, partial [Phoxinus phoxinus]